LLQNNCKLPQLVDPLLKLNNQQPRYQDSLSDVGESVSDQGAGPARSMSSIGFEEQNSRLLQERSGKGTWVSKASDSLNASAASLLLLGDSGDLYTIVDYCIAAGKLPYTATDAFLHPDLSGTPDQDVHQHRYLFMRVCETQGLNMAMRFIPGVHPSGPYHKHKALLGENCLNASWVVRTPETLDWHTKLFGRPPDMVVLAANYWEIARVNTRFSRETGFSDSFLNAFSTNLSDWVKLVRSLMPQTLVVLRTSAIPPHNKEGHSHSNQLGSRMLVASLNAVTRLVAQQQGLPLVDWEAHAVGVATERMFRDPHHPNPTYQLHWLNVYLALLKQAQPSLVYWP